MGSGIIRGQTGPGSDVGGLTHCEPLLLALPPSPQALHTCRDTDWGPRKESARVCGQTGKRCGPWKRSVLLPTAAPSGARLDVPGLDPWPGPAAGAWHPGPAGGGGHLSLLRWSASLPTSHSALIATCLSPAALGVRRVPQPTFLAAMTGAFRMALTPGQSGSGRGPAGAEGTPGVQATGRSR